MFEGFGGFWGLGFGFFVGFSFGWSVFFAVFFGRLLVELALVGFLADVLECSVFWSKDVKVVGFFCRFNCGGLRFGFG